MKLLIRSFGIAGIILFSLAWSAKGPSETIIGADSFYLDSAAQISLGRYLFYEKALSRDSTVSCASCHIQKLAFTDGLKKSRGIRNEEVTRNSPTLTNVANRPYLLLDGVNPSLEAQTIVPIQEHSEFDFNLTLILKRLNKNPTYVELAHQGFNSEITGYVYSKSIAQFERTLNSYNSPYDLFLQGDSSALSARQKRGHELFFKKLYCSRCHSGNDLTNDSLVNNGLYMNYADSGRMRLTEVEIDRAVFKVPTLRNIQVTAPYMHDGSLSSLSDVISHYSSGGKDHPSKGKDIKPFTLSEAEKHDLIDFLTSLTDTVFLYDKRFSSPF